jgi:hypothetical protein
MRSNVRVRVKLSDAFLFSPDVARFLVFAHRLAVFKRFRCNMGQRTRPRQVKRRLPVFARRRLFPCVRVKLSDACPFTSDVARFHISAHRLAVFRRFCCNTGQYTCHLHVKRRLPVFARRRPFPRFCPTSPVSTFSPFA